jgi:hypothetical protein
VPAQPDETVEYVPVVCSHVLVHGLLREHLLDELYKMHHAVSDAFIVLHRGRFYRKLVNALRVVVDGGPNDPGLLWTPLVSQ